MVNKINRPDRRVRRTKTLLKKALILLMQEKDLNEITVTEIVVKADYNKTTFYRHYENKDAIFTELKQEMLKSFAQAIRYPYKNKKHLNLDTLSTNKVILFDHIKDNADFYKLFKKPQAASQFHPIFIKTIYQLLKTDMIHIVDLQEVDPDLYVTFRTYGVWGLIINWIEEDFMTPKKQMAQQLIEISNCKLSSTLRIVSS